MVELIARGILVENEHLLLSKKHELGYYALIGGHIEKEKIEGGLKREFLEETNLQVQVQKTPFYLIENKYKKRGIKRYELGIYFKVSPIGGEFKDKREDATLQKVPIERLKELNLVPPKLKEWLIKDLGNELQFRFHLL